MPLHTRLRTSVLTLAVTLAAAPAFSATIEKADNSLPLNDPNSWVGGVVPGSSDGVLWDNLVTGPIQTVLGADLTIGAISIANPGGDIVIDNDGHTLRFNTFNATASGTNVTILANVSTGSSGAFWNIANIVTLDGTYTSPSNAFAGINKQGNGTMILGMPQLSTALSLQGGTIQLASDMTLKTLLAQSNSTFDLNGHNAFAYGFGGGGFGTSTKILNNGPLPAMFTAAVNAGGNYPVFGGAMKDGSASLSFTKIGAGVLTLTSMSTYTGTTTVARGTLLLAQDGAQNVPISNTLPTNTTLHMAGGMLMIHGAGTGGTQTVAATIIDQGESQTVMTPGVNTVAPFVNLDLGALTRSGPGGTLYVSPQAQHTSSTYTSAPLTSSGIIGGWAVYAGSNAQLISYDWATRDSTSASTPIQALAGARYTGTFAPGVHTLISGATVTAPPNASTSTLKFAGGSGTLLLNMSNSIETGGILVTSAGQINGNGPASLTSGNGSDLIIYQEFTSVPSSSFAINAFIVDNGTTSIALTKSGPGILDLSRANSYSAGTYLNDGTIRILPGASLGTGPIHVSAVGDRSSLQLGYVYAPAQAVPSIVLFNGVNLPNNMIGDFESSGTLTPTSTLDVPTGSATFSGNYTMRTDGFYQYCMGTTGGALMLTGNHTAGSPDPSAPAGSAFFTGGKVTYAGTSSLTVYGGPITLLANGPLVILQNGASFSVKGLVSGTGLDLGGGTTNVASVVLDLKDSATIDLGTTSLDLLHGSATNFSTLLNLWGGSLTLGKFVKSGGGNGQTATISFNGATIIASKDASDFLPEMPSSSNATRGYINVGGARFDTNGHSILIDLPLQHDPLLGATPDGGLVKLGTGRLDLMSNHGLPTSYTGPTVVAAGTLNISGGLNGSSDVAGIGGAGTLQVGFNAGASFALTSDGVTTSSWNVFATHVIRANNPSGGTSKVNSLFLATDANNAFTGTINLTNNKLILQSDPSVSGDKAAKLTMLQAALLAGIHSGDWLGYGITSSTVAADQSATGSHMTALALYDNEFLGLSSFGGQPVDSNSLLVTTALIGDTNFDNVVDILDVTNVASHWQTQQNSWTTGDINDDGFVDILDFTTVASHWQQTYTPATQPADVFALFNAVVVPEPSSLGLLVIPALVLLQRRRRRA